MSGFGAYDIMPTNYTVRIGSWSGQYDDSENAIYDWRQLDDFNDSDAAWDAVEAYIEEISGKCKAPERWCENRDPDGSGFVYIRGCHSEAWEPSFKITVTGA